MRFTVCLMNNIIYKKKNNYKPHVSNQLNGDSY